MLWHCRLGHPNVIYLKKLFPLLFNNLLNFNVILLMSKHVRSSYHAQEYKASHPFSVIHSYVWGPYKVKAVTKAR